MSAWISASLMMNEMEVSLEELLTNSPAKRLSPVQLHVLAALYEKDNQHASALALAVGRAATAFTPVLDSLEYLTLIKRSPDEKDRRAVTISLTIKGRELRETITDALSILDEQYIECDWRPNLERTEKPVVV